MDESRGESGRKVWMRAGVRVGGRLGREPGRRFGRSSFSKWSSGEVRAGGRFRWSGAGGWGARTNIWMVQCFKMVIWRGDEMWWVVAGRCPIAENMGGSRVLMVQVVCGLEVVEEGFDGPVFQNGLERGEVHHWGQ